MPTIGVSIALPDECGESLQDYRVEVGDPEAHLIPAHITLVPPLHVETAGFDDVLEHLADTAARHASYRTHLRGTGTFRPVTPVVFVNLVEGISECELLAADISDGLLEHEPEFPYHPHVTIAHKVPDEVLDRAFEEMSDFDCVFEVDSFWLYRYDGDAGWTKLREFPLA